ncbi:hypothetical protein pb186bvf_020435 [Paramecium bursaria]
MYSNKYKVSQQYPTENWVLLQNYKQSKAIESQYQQPQILSIKKIII